MQVGRDGNQQPLAYRYSVAPKDTVNAFKPRELASDVNKTDLRSSVFGAIWSKKFLQLPLTDFCRVVWEASNIMMCWNSNLNRASCQVTIGEEAPAVLTPAKPKFYILGSASIPPQSALMLNLLMANGMNVLKPAWAKSLGILNQNNGTHTINDINV